MFVSPVIEQRYRSSLSRYTAAMDNDRPDRIPVRFLFEEIAAKYAGYTTAADGLRLPPGIRCDP